MLVKGATVQHQAIFWLNGGLLLIKPLGTNWTTVMHEIEFETVVWKMASNWLGPNTLKIKKWEI